MCVPRTPCDVSLQPRPTLQLVALGASEKATVP